MRRGGSALKTNPDDETDVDALVIYQLQASIVIGIPAKVEAVNLGQNGQRRPPLFLSITHHGTKEQRGVLPLAIVRQLIVVAQFQAG